MQTSQSTSLDDYQLSKSHSTLLLLSGMSAESAMKSWGWIFSSFVESSSFSASISPSKTILSPLTTYKPRGTSQYLPGRRFDNYAFVILFIKTMVEQGSDKRFHTCMDEALERFLENEIHKMVETP